MNFPPKKMDKITKAGSTPAVLHLSDLLTQADEIDLGEEEEEEEEAEIMKSGEKSEEAAVNKTVRNK